MAILNMVDVTKSFPKDRYGNERVAVQDLSLEIEANTIVALLGPNGAGKTTTVKICCNLIYPSSGSVFIHGHNVAKNPHIVGKSIGAVLEGSRNIFWRWTPHQNLTYFARLRGIPNSVIAPQISSLSDRLSFRHLLHEPVQTLSRGNQQRVALACALVSKPSLILLDEPTLGLDYDSQIAVKHEVKALAQTGCAVLLTTHQLDLAAELADMVGIMVNSRLVAYGTQGDIMKPLVNNADRYRIAFANKPCSGTLQILDNYEADRKDDRGLTYEVQLAESDDLYQFMSRLSAYSPKVKALEEVRPNLTEVYVEYVGGSRS